MSQRLTTVVRVALSIATIAITALAAQAGMRWH
jgi:hypothetical protein